MRVSHAKRIQTLARGGVAQSPKITSQPSANPSEAAPGAKITLTVQAGSPEDGGTLSYQWYAVKNNKEEKLDGGDKNSFTYTIPSSAKDGDKLVFRVKITNTVPGREPSETMSDDVTVTVKKPTTPPPTDPTDPDKPTTDPDTPTDPDKPTTPDEPSEPQNAQKPTFTAMHEEVKVASGGEIRLSAGAASLDGGTLSYDWEKKSGDEWEWAYGGTYETFTGVAPEEEGWGALYYHVTVTNTIKRTDGTTDSASAVKEFTVIEDVREPMKAPVINSEGTYVAFSDDDETVQFIYSYYAEHDQYYEPYKECIRRSLARMFLQKENDYGDYSYWFYPGEKVEFIVAADDDGSYEYRWYIDGAKVEGDGARYAYTLPEHSSGIDRCIPVECVVVNPGVDGKKDGETTVRLSLYDSAKEYFKITFNAGDNGAFSNNGGNTKTITFPTKRWHRLLQDKEGSIRDVPTEVAQYVSGDGLFLEGEPFQSFLKENGLHPEQLEQNGISYISDNYQFAKWTRADGRTLSGAPVPAIEWGDYAFSEGVDESVQTQKKPFVLNASWKIKDQNKEDAIVRKVFYSRAAPSAENDAFATSFGLEKKQHPDKIEWTADGKVSKLHFTYEFTISKFNNDGCIYFTHTYHNGEALETVTDKSFSMKTLEKDCSEVVFMMPKVRFEYDGDDAKKYYAGYSSNYYHFYPHGTDVREGDDLNDGGIAKHTAENGTHKFDNTSEHDPGYWFVKLGGVDSSYVMEYVISLDHENKTQSMDFFKMYSKTTSKPADCKFIPYYETKIDRLRVYVAGVYTKTGEEKYSSLGSITTHLCVDYDNAKAYTRSETILNIGSGDWLGGNNGVPDKDRVGMYLQGGNIYIKNVSDDGRSRQDGNTVYYYSITPPSGQEYTVLKLNGSSVKATLSQEEFYDDPFGIVYYKEYDFKVKLEGIESFEFNSKRSLTIDACISELPIMVEFSLKSQ